MSITQDLAAVVQAADNLTQNVTDKITGIDQRVNQMQTDANNVVASATAQLKRAKIGIEQFPNASLILGPGEDAGLLVKQAFDEGKHHVSLHWDADGQDRHWNTPVLMPVGASLYIAGASSPVHVLGGDVRTDRACYARGRNGGTSELGSPLIFRNLNPANETYPWSDYTKVWDDISLITMNGNNTVMFMSGTYVFDAGGTIPHAFGCSLVQLNSYIYDMPCFVGGGDHSLQFYLGGPLFNNMGSTSVAEIRFMGVNFVKLDNDGPTLTADKGFKRLLDKGVSGVTADLLKAQPYTLTPAQATLNDVVHIGTINAWCDGMRGEDTQSDRPLLVSKQTWHYGSGWTTAQFTGGEGELSLHGLERIGTSDTWFGHR